MDILPGSAPMRRLWSRRGRRRLVRKCGAALTLLAFSIVAIGVPVPHAGAVRDRGTAFPCQNHHCGCCSAEDCWQHCCCFSHEEHLAWAKAHHVEPPVVVRADSGWRQERVRDRLAKQEIKTEPCQACCASPSCDRATTAPDPSERSAAKPSQTKRGIRFFAGITAAKCKGGATLWATTGITLLPVIQPISPFNLAQSGWARLSPSIPVVRPQKPPEPPPRQFGAWL